MKAKIRDESVENVPFLKFFSCNLARPLNLAAMSDLRSGV